MENTPKTELSGIAITLLKGAGFRTGSFVIVRILQVARVMLFARLFSPAELGLTNLAFGCISFVIILANFGFPQSVIRSKDKSDTTQNTIFTLSMFFGLLAFLVAVLIAPLFSRLFATNLNPFIRITAILAFAVPARFPIYLWERDLKFSYPAIASIISEICVFVFTILLQIVLKLGVWSIVVGNLSGFVLTGVFVWILYKPRLKFFTDWGSIKKILTFGTPFMVQGLNGEVMARGDNLLVGAYSGTTQLAFYNFAWQLPMMISQFTQTIDSMLLPVFAKVQENTDSTLRLFNLSNKMWSLTGSFFGFGMFLFAEQVVMLLYGEKWMPVVPILRIMSISFILRYCSGYAYDNLVIVRGRTRYTMNWSIVNTILILTLGQFMIYKLGPAGGAWFWLLQAFFLIPIVRFPLIKQELGSLQFLNHVWQPLLVGLISSALSLFVLGFFKLHFLSFVLYSIITILIYLGVYFGLLFVIDRELKQDIKTLATLALSEKSPQ